MQEKLKLSCYYILPSLKPNALAEMTKTAFTARWALPSLTMLSTLASPAHAGLGLGGEGARPGTGQTSHYLINNLILK